MIVFIRRWEGPEAQEQTAIKATTTVRAHPSGVHRDSPKADRRELIARAKRFVDGMNPPLSQDRWRAANF
jgi:hypothetical protein